jgi:DNA-binding MarR family transcriptional regulator
MMTVVDTEQADPIGGIHRSIILFVRSTRTRSSDMYHGLSFVAYSIVSYVDLSSCPHASDLAEEYGLDKSTVSRQLAGLEKAELLYRVADPRHPRKQMLKLTPKARRHLSKIRRLQRERLGQELESWPAADVAEFGRLLHRFVSRDC